MDWERPNSLARMQHGLTAAAQPVSERVGWLRGPTYFASCTCAAGTACLLKPQACLPAPGVLCCSRAATTAPSSQTAPARQAFLSALRCTEVLAARLPPRQQHSGCAKPDHARSSTAGSTAPPALAPAAPLHFLAYPCAIHSTAPSRLPGAGARSEAPQGRCCVVPLHQANRCVKDKGCC